MENKEYTPEQAYVDAALAAQKDWVDKAKQKVAEELRKEASIKQARKAAKKTTSSFKLTLKRYRGQPPVVPEREQLPPPLFKAGQPDMNRIMRESKLTVAPFIKSGGVTPPDTKMYRKGNVPRDEGEYSVYKMRLNRRDPVRYGVLASGVATQSLPPYASQFSSVEGIIR